jgi:hypothetical protein
MADWRVRGALVGAAIGGLFHVAWHMGATVPPLLELLWEWGGLFATVPRIELIGLHLGVLLVHVTVYALLGVMVALLARRRGQP